MSLTNDPHTPKLRRGKSWDIFDVELLQTHQSHPEPAKNPSGHYRDILISFPTLFPQNYGRSKPNRTLPYIPYIPYISNISIFPYFHIPNIPFSQDSPPGQHEMLTIRIHSIYSLYLYIFIFLYSVFFAFRKY